MFGGRGGRLVVEKNLNKQLALLNHLYTKIKLDYIEFDAKINFLEWVGAFDFLKMRPT